MKSFNTIFKYSAFTVLFMAVLVVGCDDDNNTNGNIDAPTVLSTSPENNDTDVAQDVTVTATFSEAMDPTTINATTFTLKQGSTDVPGTVSYTGTTATYTPTDSLAAGEDYTANITTGAESARGVALRSNNQWSFTTADSGAQQSVTVLSTSPEDNATGVERNIAVTVTFSEAMDTTTITSETFTLAQGTTAVPGTISYSGTMATYTPENLLAAGEVYTATITTGAESALGVALESDTEWSFTTAGSDEQSATVDLGTAANYVILAKSAITNIPTSAITGDLGLSPAATSSITGFALTDSTGYATSDQVTGEIYAADMADPTPANLTTAVSDMETAYTDAAGRLNPDFLELYGGDIGGQTLTPGLYKWTNTVTVPSSITLSGGAEDVWIFQISENLNLSSDVEITLSDGALAENIFWQVAGEVTIGTGAHFEGIILSMTGITLNTGATLNGRLLAQTAVALDGNTVVQP